MKIFALLFFFQLSHTICFSQDINGSWIGKMFEKNDTTILELEILVDAKYAISGYTTTFFGNGKYAKSKISGNLNKKKNLYLFYETEIVQATPYEMQSISQRFSLRYDAKSDELIGTAECIKGCLEIYKIELIRYKKDS